MRSKTSWFNKEMMIQSFRSVGWVALIYLTGLLLAVPMRILMIWSSENQHNYYNHYENVFAYSSEIQLVLNLLIPVLLAIFLFRFLHVKNASDFMHSLPIKRTDLYNIYVGMGVLYLVLPVVVTGLVLLAMQGVMDFQDYYSMLDVFQWMGYTLVITLLIFTTGIFVGTVTGLSAVQGVLAYILILFPLGITGLLFMNMTYFLYGFSTDYYMSNQIIRFSPISAFADSLSKRNDELLNALEIIIYLIISAILYFAGMQVYKRRNLEGVSQAFVFKPLKPIFKYGVTFCTMLLGGVYFSETQHAFSWLIVGYVLGAVVGYLIAEMLLQKTWRVLAHLKGLFVYAGLIAISILFLQFDVTGYENKIPELENIDQVFIGRHAFKYQEEELSVHSPDYSNAVLTDKENIQAIQRLHQYLIEQKDMFIPYHYQTRNIFIAYELENGEKVIREYRIKETEEIVKYLKPVYEAQEYKEKANRIFKVSNEDVTRITINSRDGETIIHEPEKISEALKALKEDVKNEQFTGFEEHGSLTSQIMIHLSGNKENQVHMEFKWTYDQFEKWLEDEGELDNARVTPEEVEYTVIVPSKEIDFNGNEKGVSKQILNSDDALKITSTEKIQESIEKSTWGDPSNQYFIVFHYKSKIDELHSFHESNVPDFVKEYFE
ncbi:DUF6449 domain-containing protein [Pseudalkalibacillus sp. A8]|uniref:DUF6449 domain-containing protein n=1 Tax=Pseudalkalibacillus sp. A8 TaxID=3382641 RepID=UPI0038B45B77